MGSVWFMLLCVALRVIMGAEIGTKQNNDSSEGTAMMAEKVQCSCEKMRENSTGVF